MTLGYSSDTEQESFLKGNKADARAKIKELLQVADLQFSEKVKEENEFTVSVQG